MQKFTLQYLNQCECNEIIIDFVSTNHFGGITLANPMIPSRDSLHRLFVKTFHHLKKRIWILRHDHQRFDFLHYYSILQLFLIAFLCFRLGLILITCFSFRPSVLVSGIRKSLFLRFLMTVRNKIWWVDLCWVGAFSIKFSLWSDRGKCGNS